MKNKIILHIPHSSLLLPKIFNIQKKNVDDKKINNFNLQMTDLYTNDLFLCTKFCHIKSNVSRIVCDVEKFIDDKIEVMSKYGLGVIYAKNIYGEKLFNSAFNFEVYKQKILDKYYFPYHKKLDKLVMQNLKKNKNVVFIDCHSFSSEIALSCPNKDNFPDICLGFDDNQYYNVNLVAFIKKYFENFGYIVKTNYPYQGVMIPNCLYNKSSPHFFAVMIEINRKLYLNANKKNSRYKNLKNQIYNLFKTIEKVNLFNQVFG